jgi:hypothetical protein
VFVLALVFSVADGFISSLFDWTLMSSYCNVSN